MTNQFTAAAAPQGEVTPPFVESMLCRIAANPLLLEELSGLLDPRHFYKPEEQHLAIMYRAMCAVYAAHHALEYEAVRGEVERLLCDIPLPAALAEHLMNEGNPDGLLRWALHTGTAQIARAPIEQSREMIRRFLQERSIYLPLAQAMQVGMPADMQSMLDAASHQWQRIGQLDTDPISSGVPDGRGGVPLIIRSTGVSFLDMHMDGGQAQGEAYGLIGPTGVGKTALACSMAGAMLLQESQRAAANPAYTPQMVYYVTYEAGRDEIRQRVISSLAEIARDTVKHIDFGVREAPACFSSAARGDFKPYEMAQYVPPGQQRTGELERFLNAYPQLENYLRVVDLSGLGDQRYCRPGVGGLAELVGLIAKDQARLGSPGVAVVFVDYTLLAVERWLSDQGKDPAKNVRFALPDFVDGCRMQIAGRFNTSIWLLQQFNTSANKKSPTAVMSHTDAAEAGGRFAHALSFCAEIGNKDMQTNCTILSFSKRRRAGGARPERILMIDPLYHRLNDVSNDYVVDRTRQQIVSRLFATQIQGTQTDANRRGTTSNDASAMV